MKINTNININMAEHYILSHPDIVCYYENDTTNKITLEFIMQKFCEFNKCTYEDILPLLELIPMLNNPVYSIENLLNKKYPVVGLESYTKNDINKLKDICEYLCLQDESYFLYRLTLIDLNAGLDLTKTKSKINLQILAKLMYVADKLNYVTNFDKLVEEKNYEMIEYISSNDDNINDISGKIKIKHVPFLIEYEKNGYLINNVPPFIFVLECCKPAIVKHMIKHIDKININYSKKIQITHEHFVRDEDENITELKIRYIINMRPNYETAYSALICSIHYSYEKTLSDIALKILSNPKYKILECDLYDACDKKQYNHIDYILDANVINFDNFDINILSCLFVLYTGGVFYYNEIEKDNNKKYMKKIIKKIKKIECNEYVNLFIDLLTDYKDKKDFDEIVDMLKKLKN